jgi:hypothetical protein
LSQLLLAFSLPLLALFAPSEQPHDQGALVVREGATDIARSFAPGEAKVDYIVRDESPGTDTLLFITDALVRHGWRPDLDASFIPESPPATPETGLAAIHGGTHTWSAVFRNGEGDEVHYSLVRRCPHEELGLHSVYLHVTGHYYRRDVAKRRRAEGRVGTTGRQKQSEQNPKPKED